MAAKAKKARKTKAAATGSVIDPKYRKNYTIHDVKTASGKRRSVDVDDKVAKLLRGKSVEELRKVAREHKLLEPFDEKWGKLNAGLCRMAFGNALRGVLNGKKERVTKKAA